MNAQAGPSDAPSAPAAAGADAGGARRRHRILVPSLAVLGLLCIFVSTVSVWLRDSALDSGVWATESGQLLQSQNVRNVLSAYVADQAITSSDAEAALANALPPRLKPLAAPGAAALSRFSGQAVDRALSLPRVQALWMEANRRAHERLVAFLKGDTNRLQASNGAVQLNLAQVIASVAADVGVSQSAIEKAQSHIEPIVLVRSDQLGAAQTGVQLVEVLSVWPFVIGVALLAVSVYLAEGRRRTTVRGISVGFLLMGIILLVGRNVVGGMVVDSLVKVDSVKAAVNDAWSIYTNLLADSAAAGIAIGILGLAWSWVSGPMGAAVSVRRTLAPTFREHTLAPHVVLGVLALLVLLVHPIGTPRRTLGILIVALLAFLGLEVLRRQSVREFPEATAAVPSVARDLLVRARARRASAAPVGDRVAGLERLAELHDRGALSDKEFEEAKSVVLSS